MSQRLKTPSQNRFERLIAEHCTDSIVFTDPAGLTLWVNAAFTRMSGYCLDEMKGHKPGSVLQGDSTDPATVAAIGQAIRERRSIRTEIVNYTKDGTPYWIDLNINPIFDAAGKLTYFMSLERDVTDRNDLIASTSAALEKERERRRERKLLSQMSEWLFAAQDMEELQDVITNAMQQLFPKTDGVLFIFSNSRDVLDKVSQWGSPDTQGHLLAAEHLRANDCWALRRGRPYSFGTSEIDFRCQHVGDVDHVTFCLPIIAHGDTIGMMTIGLTDHPLSDGVPVSRQQTLAPEWELAMICAEQISLAAANVRLQIELQDQSVRDPLTGLWNRRWFLETASREMKRADANDQPFSLVSIDVDHFKKFNDTHGHDAGDMVLKMIGHETARNLPESVHACRMGGEELALICPGLGAAEAAAIAERFKDHIGAAELVYAGGKLPRVSFSGGAAEVRKGETLTSLLNRSDALLYRAKSAGRDQVMHDAATAHADLPRPGATLTPECKTGAA